MLNNRYIITNKIVNNDLMFIILYKNGYFILIINSIYPCKSYKFLVF